MECKQLHGKCGGSCAFEGEEKSCPYFKDAAELEIVYIDVGLIDPAPWNRNIGDVSELAASIKAEGVHTPLTVCPHVQGLEGRYTAVAGNRRRAAAEKAGLQTVPCIVRPLSVEVRKAVRGNPVKALLSVAYCLLEKEAGSWTKLGLYDTDIRGYQTEHQKAQKLDLLYRCLETMGYQMSGDELAVQAGSWDGYDRSDRAMKGFKERKKELDKRIYK